MRGESSSCSGPGPYGEVARGEVEVEGGGGRPGRVAFGRIILKTEASPDATQNPSPAREVGLPTLRLKGSFHLHANRAVLELPPLEAQFVEQGVHFRATRGQLQLDRSALPHGPFVRQCREQQHVAALALPNPL